MNAALTGLFAIALYAFGVFHILAARRNAPARLDETGSTAVSAPKGTIFIALGVLAVALHAISAWLGLVTEAGINLSFFAIASIVGLALAGTTLGVANRVDFPSLLAVAYTIAIITIVGSIVRPSTAAPRVDLENGLVFHVVASIAGYTALTMAAVHSVLTLTLENRLRRHETFSLVVDFPPLESMVALLFRLIWIGFALLTIAIASGFFFLDDLFDQRVVHHTVLSISSWLVYIALLAGHLLFGWRGKTTIRWTLVAFALLALAYFGSKFVLEFVLGPT